jgi:isoamylase
MMLAGDEFRRTQQGNNNAYCQDNAISWVNWDLKEAHKDAFRFTRMLIAFRKRHHALRRSTFLTGQQQDGFSSPDIVWHGVKPFAPDWSTYAHFVACTLNGACAIKDSPHADTDIYMAFNASLVNLPVTLPPAPNGGRWKRVIDTSLPSPEDIVPDEDAPVVTGERYLIRRESCIVLISGS